MLRIGAIVGLGMLVFPLMAKAIDVAGLSTRLKPSVTHVSILNSSGKEIATGSGFFVSASGMMATNHHVVEDAASLKIRTSDGLEHNAVGVLAQNENDDLAIVQVEGANYVPVELGDLAAVQVGEEIINIGSPDGLDFSVSAGTVAAIRPTGLPERYHDSKQLNGTPVVQVTALSGHGSSGSPVFNANGKVIGVMESITRDNVGRFAVAVDALKKLQGSITPGSQVRAFEKARSVTRNLLYSAFFFGGIGFVAIGVQGYNRWRALRRKRLLRRLEELKGEMT